MNKMNVGRRTLDVGRWVLEAGKPKSRILFCLFAACALIFSTACFAQNGELDIAIDATAKSVPLPKVFRPNIDLSGRGLHRDITWPQGLSAKEVLDTWQKDIGFGGIYRLQFSLWDLAHLSKDKEAQGKLLVNYESVIKNINDSGGVVILDIFGTPAGLGKALDKKAPPWDLKAFKELVKGYIRELSCEKKYNIWYEVWNAPDLDDFFLGRKQEYFNLYRAVAEGVKELEDETKIHIPVGGPGVSWWFQSLEGNTITTPEKSLIYEFIKYCYRRHLPLDFVSWHGFSSDPQAEKENTTYKKTAALLIRDWLSYFGFERAAPLIVDEWNYDRSANVLPEREEKAYISASYIPRRIKNMYEAGIDYQLYFCLEDFKENKEGVVRNVGIFSYDTDHDGYKGSPKAAYNVFRMLNNLGNELLPLKINDDFIGIIATRRENGFVLLFYNYIDPDIVKNYFSRNIATLSSAERKAVLNYIKSGEINKIMRRQVEIVNLRTTKRVKALLKKAQELNDSAEISSGAPRALKINLKNLKDNYLYQRFAIDSACSSDCPFTPVEEKEAIAESGAWQEILSLKPYSVQMIVLTKKPPQPEVVQSPPQESLAAPAEPVTADKSIASAALDKPAVPAAPAEKP
ncbi:MAG: hypothetical protein Q8O22_01870 [Candidatus Omnitrophota bacterium]|nr:hypothetical protein [Candidatus Omnitrophota bacterium]